MIKPERLELLIGQQRPRLALGGRPPALVYWQRNDID